jgi:dipeptidyl aminopeptidase/acylaminoacyl peptidase
VALLAGAFVAAPTAPVFGAGRSPVLEDYWSLPTVADPRISPDGTWVAYTLSRPSRERDADETDLWLVRYDGGAPRPLTRTPGSEHHPRWRPDGRAIAFLADREEEDAGDQVWLLDLAGGDARRLTRFDGDIQGFEWSPDGRQLVIAAIVPRASDDDADREPPLVIDRLQFKWDDRGYLGAERTQLFLVDVASGVSTALTQGPYDHIQPSWSPDGRRIAFFTKRGDEPDAHSNWDVYIVDAAPGATPQQLTTSPSTDGDPTEEWGPARVRFDARGARVAYLTGGDPRDLWYGLVEPAVTDIAGGRTTRPVAALDRNAVDPRWSADGRSLYFRLEDDRSLQLARVRLADGRVDRLTPPAGVATEYDVGPRDRIVVVHGDSARPGELYALEGGGLRALTSHTANWRAGLSLAHAEPLEWQSPDGTAIRGLLYRPIGARDGSAHPTLLWLHGGPVAQHQHEFDFRFQWFAAKGYAVVLPNPRGSSGRGYAFQRVLFADWGHVDVPDVLGGIDRAVALGVAHPARLGVGGWSYGGMLTNYVIASDSRFRAAVSGAGMGNMLGGYGVDHYQREWEAELGLPWDTTALWMRLSYPFLHANRIRTPTLFMVGSDDFNVPLPATEQMYQALRRLGVPTQLVIYRGESHGFSRPTLRVDRLQRWTDWFDRWLK